MKTHNHFHESNSAFIESLAGVLSDNIITNSFNGDLYDPISQILDSTRSENFRRSRNILILGAGASHNVNPSIKLASTAIKDVEIAFIKEYGGNIIDWKEKNQNIVVQRILSKDDKRILNYLRDRLLTEIYFEIISSSDGIINLRQIKESRIQKYFSLYKYYSSKISNSKTENLFFFFELFQLKPYRSHNKETWVFEDNPDYIKDLKKVLEKNLSKNVSKIFKTDHRLIAALQGLEARKKLFLNVRTRENDDYITVMSNLTSANIIKTDIQWIYTFQNFFSSEKALSEWDVILAITETGGIFASNDISEKLRDKKLMLICAYNTAYEQKLSHIDISSLDAKDQNITSRRKQDLFIRKLDKIKDRTILKMLHYRNHNNHLILFAKIKNKDEFVFSGGIYYSRRQQTKRVTPIITKNAKDLDELFNIFANYWERSTNEENMENLNEFIHKSDAMLTDDIRSWTQHKRHESIEKIKTRIISEFNARR